MRNGPVDGNALRIQRREGVVAMEVCYSLNSTARGHISVPGDPAALRSIGRAFNELAASIEREAEEPDEVVINEYEPDEVVIPELYAGDYPSDSKGEGDG